MDNIEYDHYSSGAPVGVGNDEYDVHAALILSAEMTMHKSSMLFMLFISLNNDDNLSLSLWLGKIHLLCSSHDSQNKS